MPRHSSEHPEGGDASFIGILLAAGRSTRMGLDKQLLPWPPGTTSGQTVAAASFDLLDRIAARVVLVEGASPEPLRAALHPRRFVSVGGAPDGEMMQSLRLGLIAAESLRRTEVENESGSERSAGTQRPRWFIIHLADHPAVRHATIDQLAARAAARPGRVIIPEREGRGGHPAFVPASWYARIISWPGPGGLAGLWRTCALEVERVPVDDPGVRVDLDTPGEYDAHR